MHQNASVTAESSWNNRSMHDESLFSVLPEFIRHHSIKPEEIDTFAVGLGPGSFAGIRIALSAARGLALPGGKEVIGIGSSDAIAFEILTENASCDVIVVGDARRNKLWHSGFSLLNGSIQTKSACSLIDPEDLSSMIPDGAIVASPDFERIERILRESCNGETLIEKPVVPKARVIAELASKATGTSNPLDAVSPLYLHPPVFT